MMITPVLQRQYIEISQLADKVLSEIINLKTLNLDNTKILSPQLQSLINSMLGKLLVHLSMTDSVLYTKALNTINNVALNKKAHQLIKEFGHLKHTTLAYRESILHSKGYFNSSLFFQTSRLIDLLKKRMKKEEQELYPLFDTNKPIKLQNHKV